MSRSAKDGGVLGCLFPFWQGPIFTPLPIVFTGLHHLSHNLSIQSHYSASGRPFPRGTCHRALTGCP